MLRGGKTNYLVMIEQTFACIIDYSCTLARKDTYTQRTGREV